MKFDCGETAQEEINRLGEWHRWFAWYPIKISEHDCRWLEFVERKIKIKSIYMEDFYDTFYRAIK